MSHSSDPQDPHTDSSRTGDVNMRVLIRISLILLIILLLNAASVSPAVLLPGLNVEICEISCTVLFIFLLGLVHLLAYLKYRVSSHYNQNVHWISGNVLLGLFKYVNTQIVRIANSNSSKLLENHLSLPTAQFFFVWFHCKNV